MDIRREQASSRLTDLLFANAAIGLCLVAPDGKILRANAEWVRYAGFSPERMQGADFIELFPEMGDVSRGLLARARVGDRVEVPPHARHVHGCDTAWEGSIEPLPMEDGTGLLVTTGEVSSGGAQSGAGAERLADLVEREERFRLLAQAMPQIVCVLQPDGTPEYVNGSWVAFSGLDLEATARAGWENVVHPDDVDAVRACRRRALKLLAPQDIEVRYRGADGTHRWFLSRLAPVVEGGRAVRLVGAAMDIQDRRSAEEALRAANERLRDADRRKDEFLGMLSHELRNPLAPIRNAAYVLRHVDPADPHAARAQLVIERQIEHLTRLVDDLLDVTRVARGKIQLRKERIDLRDLVRRTGDDFQSVLEGRGISFRTLLPEDRIWVHADPTRLTQVIGNLLHNAAKFTPSGNEVTLSVEGLESDARIRVRDTGAGIDPSLLPTVFDPFVQGDPAPERTEGGLGLGLTLVKGLVELHGGSVNAGSAGKGMGSEFTVRLPIVEPAEDAAPHPRRGERRSGPRRVLVVDDNRDAADSLAAMVDVLGHSVDVAYDGPTAVQKARAENPDVVLCDIGLPGMSGYEVARALRTLGAAGMRLVAVSGYAQPEDVKRAIDAGFDAHVAKPPDPAHISRLLD